MIMMNIDFDTYLLIADLLDDDTLSIADIAEIANVSYDTVKYVDRAENDVMWNHIKINEMKEYIEELKF